MRRCLAVDCTGDWRASMRPAYADSVLAWRRLEAAGTGPAAPGETPSTVYFWPDKHGTAGRQLAAALRARDESLTRASDLANKSVGLQSGRATAGGAARRAQASARALGAGAGNGGGLQCPRRGLTR
jgi:predicted lipoprotein